MKRKSKKKANRWEDHYTRQARKERYPARSVYKLKEIQQKYRLIKKGNRVLDLGCSPGSWMLYAAEMCGNSGKVVGIDLKPVSIQTPSNIRVYQGDVLEPDATLREILDTGFNVVLSDMAPATSGNKFADAVRSFDLCRAAISVTQQHLFPGGAFACKIFQGEAFDTLIDLVKGMFEKHKIYKPQSSRKASKEIYIIGIGKKIGGQHVGSQ